MIQSRNQRVVRAIQSARQVNDALKQNGGEECKKLAADLEQSAVDAASEKIVIAVVGSAKRGKSTLVNGLLGEKDDKYAPVGRFPATNVVSVFARSDSEHVRVRFEDGTTREIDPHQIREYACEEQNPKNVKQVQVIDAMGPFSRLNENVLLVDLPGADNALAQQHAQTTRLFLPRADAIIFLVSAGEPINAAEQALLREIKGIDVRRLFFVVNKKDQVDLGDMTKEELAEGIEHNRRILANAGYEGQRIYQVSAKQFLDGNPSSGVEGLLADIQRLIESDRLTIIAERLESRTQNSIRAGQQVAANELQLAKATAEELELERKEVTRVRRDTRYGRSAREFRFRGEWTAALSDLKKYVEKSETELHREYSTLIEGTSAVSLQPLAESVHSDVSAALSERLVPEIDRCNGRLRDAMAELVGSVDVPGVQLGEAPQAAQTSIDSLKAAMTIGSSAVPGVALGAASLAVPGLVGSLIASAAPAAVATTWNPITWVSASVASAGGAVVGSAQVATVAALGAVLIPISIVAISFGCYRGFRKWKSIQVQNRNELKTKLTEMLRESREALVKDINTQMLQIPEILSLFDSTLNAKLDEFDDRLEQLIKNRPSPERVAALESACERLNKVSNAAELSKLNTSDTRQAPLLAI